MNTDEVQVSSFSITEALFETLARLFYLLRDSNLDFLQTRMDVLLNALFYAIAHTMSSHQYNRKCDGSMHARNPLKSV